MLEREQPLADFSPEWAEHAIDYIRRNGLLERELSQEALRVMAIGLLICDDNGMFRPEDMHEALDDPSIINAADQLLRKAAL